MQESRAGRPHVFLSHSHQDDAVAYRLADDLRAAGVDLWIDIVNVNDGDFLERINEALSMCEWLIVTMSPNALKSKWVRLEVNTAIGRVVQGRMKAVIPVLVAPCDPAAIPATWQAMHFYDLTEDYPAAVRAILRTLGVPSSGEQLLTPPPPSQIMLENMEKRLETMGFHRRTVSGDLLIEAPTRDIDTGTFLMGTDPERDRIGDPDEQPSHEVRLEAFSIGTYPVTVAEYACFVASTGQAPPPAHDESTYTDWGIQTMRLDHPVTCVNYQSALDYADWLAILTGRPWRLPTEAEWEKAARWDPVLQVSRLYPWGDLFDRRICNTAVNGRGGTVPVGVNEANKSPWGVHDMAGNVWNWTTSMPVNYPYVVGDGRDYRYNVRESRVIRGGSWAVSPRNARSAFREIVGPRFVHGACGFRLVVDKQ